MGNVIIILNYNDLKNTNKLLNHIKNYSLFDKIIVVDNSSTDISYKILKKKENFKIKIIRLTENKGYAHGNNFGAFFAIEKYNPKYLFFANPDVIFSEKVVITLINTLETDSQYAVGSAKVEFGYNLWNIPNYKDTLLSLFLICFTIKKKLLKNKTVKIRPYAEVGVVEGAFFCIKSSIFSQINGFDERTFLYYEENILAQKLKKIGFKEIMLTNESYQHLHSASIKKHFKSKARAFKNYRLSVSIYLLYYLKVNKLQFKIFQIAYFFALLERYIYDFINIYLLNIVNFKISIKNFIIKMRKNEI